MSQRHLVRGAVPLALNIGRGLAVFATIAALIVWLSGIAPALWFFLGGIGLGVVLEVIAMSRRRERAWVEIEPAGFTVIDRHGSRSYRDDQVVGIAFYVKKQYANGTHNRNRRTCRLWLASEPAPFLMDNTYKLDEPDPMAPLINRLLDLLREGFSAALEHGVPIVGDGWELHRTELRCTDRKRRMAEPLPIADVAAVELRDGKLGIWRRGEDLPCMQFDPNGRNAWLLQLLLEERLQQSVALTEPPEGSLGRILFQRRTKPAIVVALYALGVASLITGIVLLTFNQVEFQVGAAVAILGAGAFAFGGFVASKSNFRTHEAGVFKSGLWGSQTLRYADVAAFTYGATRQYYNGAYTGTILHLRFDPKPGAGQKITYGTTVHGDDADLDNLRDFIARVIAAQMLQRLQAGEEVPWTDNLWFCPEGFRYRPAGMLARKPAEFLRYENYAGWNMNEGHFFLFEREKKNAVMSEAASARNFFPGFMVLLQLLHSDAPAEEPANE